MNGLVSGYGTDSEDEDAKDDSQISEVKSTSANDWLECMDNTTGYPYYWNRETNEVRWDRPPEMPIAQKETTKPATKEVVMEKKSFTAKTKKAHSRSKSPTVAPQAFIGPTLPQLTPEEVARQKVIKFEEAMAKDLEKEILKEDPPDWKKAKPQKGLYSKPFAWKKSTTCLQTYRLLETTLRNASHSISLIAGVYGDEDDDEEFDEKPSPPKARRTGVHVKVQKPASKQLKPLLKEVPGIFKETDEDEDEDQQQSSQNNDQNSDDKDIPKKKRRWDMKGRTYINSTAEKLCLKLEYLEVSKIAISPLKLLAVQVETLFAAWQCGALSNSYLQTALEKLDTSMADIENHHLAPPGWRAVWDRSTKKYAYENLITREIQFEKPDEEDDDDDDIEVIPSTEKRKEMVDVQQPPLPPQPPKEMIQPPLPPEISLIPPKPPEPQNQVEDMELSDEEEAEAAPIIETRNNGNNDQLTDALSSFYSDLANIDHPGSVSQETTPNPTPPQIHSPGPSFVKESSPALSDDRSNSPSGDSLEERRKRKTKISSGISMKKKNVNSLVAKWQTIQQEVKRNK